MSFTMNPILISKSHCRASESPPIRSLIIVTGALLLLVAGMTSSCHTTQGLGRDVEEAGEGIQDAARR